jgi:hypothetical protein
MKILRMNFGKPLEDQPTVLRKNQVVPVTCGRSMDKPIEGHVEIKTNV